MKKIKIMNILWVLSLIIVGLCAFYAGKISGVNSMFEEPKISLSSNYEYKKVYGNEHSKYFQILIFENAPNNNDDETHYYLLEDMFFTRFSVKIGWGEKDTLWINSSDSGTYYWTNLDGKWVKGIPDDESIILAPDDFK